MTWDTRNGTFTLSVVDHHRIWVTIFRALISPTIILKTMAELYGVSQP